jgi:hypothetical protein
MSKLDKWVQDKQNNGDDGSGFNDFNPNLCPCGEVNCEIGAGICHSCLYEIEFCDCEGVN